MITPFCNSSLDLHDIESECVSPAVRMWSDLQRAINMSLSLIEIISPVGYVKGQWTQGPKLYCHMQLYPTTQANLYTILSSLLNGFLEI